MGEKPNKYFLNLENSNFIFKNIKELLLVNGENVTKPDEVLEEMRIFYQSLYSYKPIKDLDNSKLSEFPNEFNTLNETEDERLSLDSEISEKELKCQVFGSGSNKSPGPDGYTNEIYKAFGAKIKKIFLLSLMRHFYHDKYIIQNHLMGIITCIPKGDKLRNK